MGEGGGGRRDTFGKKWVGKLGVLKQINGDRKISFRDESHWMDEFANQWTRVTVNFLWGEGGGITGASYCKINERIELRYFHMYLLTSTLVVICIWLIIKQDLV